MTTQRTTTRRPSTRPQLARAIIEADRLTLTRRERREYAELVVEHTGTWSTLDEPVAQRLAQALTSFIPLQYLMRTKLDDGLTIEPKPTSRPELDRAVNAGAKLGLTREEMLDAGALLVGVEGSWARMSDEQAQRVGDALVGFVAMQYVLAMRDSGRVELR